MFLFLDSRSGGVSNSCRTLDPSKDAASDLADAPSGEPTHCGPAGKNFEPWASGGLHPLGSRSPSGNHPSAALQDRSTFQSFQ